MFHFELFCGEVLCYVIGHAAVWKYKLFPRKVRTYLEKWSKDHSSCISKLKGSKQLGQNLVLTEVLGK